MRQALGKGLNALLGDISLQQNVPQAGGNGIQKIDIQKIIPNRYQPRKDFNEESLKELAESIKRYGLTQPVVVVYDTGLDKYELVVGERRFRATKLAGLTEIEAIVHSILDEKQMCALALIENIQREDLNPIETATGYKSLMQKFALSQSDITEYCGKSKAAISNSLRLLSLEETIQEALRSGEITEGHGKVLLTLPEGKQRQLLFKKIINSKLSVRQAEHTARSIREPQTANKRVKSADTKTFEQSLQEALGTKVELKQAGKKKNKGILAIHYNSLEELENIASRLKNKLL
jgi:ParB family chromosome partitioning protein